MLNLFRDLRRLGARGLRLPSEREILAFIDPALFHHRQDDHDAQTYLNQQQALLAQQLASGADLDGILLEPSAGGVETQRLFFAGEAARAKESEHEKALETLSNQHALEQAKLKQQLTDETSQHEKAIETLSNQHALEQAKLKQQLTDETSRHRRRESEFEQAREADNKRLQARLAEETNRHRHRESELEAQIELSSIERGRLAARAEELEIRLDAERAQANQLLQEASGLSTEIAGLRAEKRTLEKRLDGTEKERDRLLRQQQALSDKRRELEQRHRAQAVRLSQTDRYLRHLARDITATRESWRWRIGNATVRTAELLLMRRGCKLGIDQIQETLQAALALQRASAVRPKAPRDPSAPPATATSEKTSSHPPTP